MSPIACNSFKDKNLSRYFITSIIIKAFVTALLLSSFIYLTYFNITNYLLHSVLACAGLWLLFKSDRIGYFFTGFFIGILWFYWISLSFRYYGDLAWLIPIVIIGIGIIYGLLFLIPSLLTNSAYLHAIALVLFSQIAPFGFNWFNFELILYYTPFGLTSLQVIFLIISILLVQNSHKGYRFLAFICFIAAFDFSNKEPPKMPDIDLKIVQTRISQDKKWETEAIIKHVQENFKNIESAIEEKKQLIILPETAFALYLNKNEVIVAKLLEYSQNISIITGALGYEEGKYYNSAYFFNKGIMQRADKVVLVPFAEKVPLPNLISYYINSIFFNGASDFSEAEHPSDFIVDGIKIRSAVCFEGSRSEIYEDSPKIISVISNNAWFLPSIQPTMQNLMLSLYATKNGAIILHSVNGDGSKIIVPRKSILRMVSEQFSR
ncbi:MAG: apolipoprotein N-acyltransferase [Campylobacteraceae bacterium]|jgi:apolipoprotein N-acyltransferase|nr:apolipoprotein N-acyltransferase [Campylobacteraceae bacterium]